MEIFLLYKFYIFFIFHFTLKERKEGREGGRDEGRKEGRKEGNGDLDYYRAHYPQETS
jgi:hypothetical protein